MTEQMYLIGKSELFRLQLQLKLNDTENLSICANIRARCYNDKLSAASTTELAEELAKRAGVDEYSVNIGQRYHIEVFSGYTGNRPESTVAGPARILVVKGQ